MILANVNIGTGPSAGDGDPLRTAFNTINSNFAKIQSNVNSLTNSVTTVAGRTGNVTLTTQDIVGINNYATVSYVTSITGGNVIANVQALESNVALIQADINTLYGNAGIQSSTLATLTSNAATQAGILTTLTSNAASQSGELATLLSNAAVQAGDIASLLSNAGSQHEAITSLQSNAAVQAGDIATIYANLGAVSGSLATLTSNAAVQAGDIATMVANAGTQHEAISNLQSNAAVQAGLIAGLQANVNTYGNSNVASYLSSYGGNVSVGNIIFDNLSVQTTAYTGTQWRSNLNSTLTSKPSWLSYYPGLKNQEGVQYGFDNDGMFFTSSSDNDFAYPIQTNLHFHESDILEVTTTIYFGAFNNDHGLCIFPANTRPIWKTSTDPSRIAFQYSTGIPVLYGQTTANTAPGSPVLSNGNYYTIKFIYDPNNNVTVETFSGNTATGSAIDSRTINEVLPAGDYRLGFDADNDAGGVKSYFKNLTVRTLTDTVVNDLEVQGEVNGNLIPGANVTYSLGSITNQWKDLWVSNNTIYIGGTALTISGGNLLVNGNTVSGGDTYGNVQVATYLPTYDGSFGGNIDNHNGYINFTASPAPGGSGITFADATTQTSAYSNVQVATYLPTYTGNVQAGNVKAVTAYRFATGAVTITNGDSHVELSPDTGANALAGVKVGGGGYILGPNASRCITLNYGSVGGAVGLQANVTIGTGGSGNLVVLGRVTAGNITANYISGDGSAITSLSGAEVSGNVAEASLAYSVNISPVILNQEYHVAILPAKEGAYGVKAADGTANVTYNPVQNRLTIANIAATGSIQTSGIDGRIGYSSGGYVIQSGNSSGVSLNTISGNIKMDTVNIAASSAHTVALSNNKLEESDLILVQVLGTSGIDLHVGAYYVTTNTAIIYLRNISGSPVGPIAPMLKFAIIKAPSS